MDRVNGWLRKCPAWALYVLAPWPAAWWFWQGLGGGLGAEPIKALEHLYGEFALQLLIAGLAVTPLRRFAGLNLLKFRRAIGLIAFFYVCLHLAVWLVLDMNLLWSQLWADILKRPYITIGMAGFVLLVPLALTSNDRSVRLMRAGWRKLHRLVYVAVPLGALHFVMLRKGFQIEPVLYLGAVLLLLALRLRLRRNGRIARA